MSSTKKRKMHAFLVWDILIVHFVVSYGDCLHALGSVRLKDRTYGVMLVRTKVCAQNGHSRRNYKKCVYGFGNTESACS
ncbi:hypothetical protein BS50DRAFT_5654 [Corynespora cassiicola Philippines]|uniref:Uncharacterized protein n=1 Tax=Corynespora cassiicola Philippines TaxID=1448308 RepID=A0A2T2P8M3_CORCC|nr:hypothetical protein BS50DRAFT_5654 [Corynespora cassiicola Philippines]